MGTEGLLWQARRASVPGPGRPASPPVDAPALRCRVTRVLVAMSRALERRVYQPWHGTRAWQEGVFAGPARTRLLGGLWQEAARTLEAFLDTMVQRRPRLRLLLGHLNWDAAQLAGVVLPYVLADGAHRVKRMRHLLGERGEIYARNWVLQIARQRARKELDALGRRQRAEREAGLRLHPPSEGEVQAHDAALVAEEILSRLSCDQRRVLLVYSVHKFADPVARKCRISIRKAAQTLTERTRETWTYHRVRSRHEELCGLLGRHVGPEDPHRLHYVVSLLTLRLLSGPPVA